MDACIFTHTSEYHIIACSEPAPSAPARNVYRVVYLPLLYADRKYTEHTAVVRDKITDLCDSNYDNYER